MDHVAIGFKQLNVTSKDPHVNKQMSLDKIRVWQLLLFTYLLLEIKWEYR